MHTYRPFGPAKALFFILSLLLGAASCSDDEDIRFSGGGTTAASPGRRALSRIETPALKENGTVFVEHWTKEGGDSVMDYCLEYDKAKRHSRWVAFRFDGQTRARTVSRSDEPFQDDPKLSADLKIGASGFGAGYDRGHLCASADRLYSREANEKTFYMTNMSPQLSAFNQGYWITFEGLVQSLGRSASFADTLYVVKGGTVEDDQLNGYIARPNGAQVAVPKYYFMALLKVKNHAYSAIGFWLEHKNHGYSYDHQAPDSELAARAVSIDSLEKLTGIDFFHNLPDNVEQAVERGFTTGAWNL